MGEYLIKKLKGNDVPTWNETTTSKERSQTIGNALNNYANEKKRAEEEAQKRRVTDAVNLALGLNKPTDSASFLSNTVNSRIAKRTVDSRRYMENLEKNRAAEIADHEQNDPQYGVAKIQQAEANRNKNLLNHAMDIQKRINSGELKNTFISSGIPDGKRVKENNEYLTDSEKEFINEKINSRYEEEMKNRLADADRLGREHPLAAAGVNVAGGLLGSVMTPVGAALDIINGREINPNNPIYGVQRQSEQAQESIASGIKERRGFEEGSFGANVVDFGVGTGLSMAQTVARMALNPVAGSVQAGLSAGSSSMLEAKKNGASNAQALAMGIAQGINEGLFEKYSLQNLSSLGASNVDSVKTFLKNVGKSMLTEGSEEFFTDWANAVADYYIMGEQSNYQQIYDAYRKAGLNNEQAKIRTLGDILKQSLVSFAGGAVSGAILGSGAQAAEYGFRKNQKAEIGKGTDISFSEMADSIDTNTENEQRNKEAERIQERLMEYQAMEDDGVEVTNAQKSAIMDDIRDFANVNEGFMVSDDTSEEEYENPVSSLSWENDQESPSISERNDSNSVIEESRLVGSLDGEGKNVVKNVIDQYKDSEELTSKVIGTRDVYTSARYNMTNVENMYKRGNEYGLTPDELDRAIKAGSADRISDMQKQNRIAAVKAGLTKESFKYKELSREQKNTLDAIGKRTHVRIVLDGSMRVNENAAWEKGTRTIRINPHTNNLTGSILHELTHYLKDTDVTSYSDYRDAVVTFLAGREGGGTESFLENKINEYTDRYESHTRKTMSRDDIIDEIVSDGAMDFFNDDGIVSSYQSNKGFMQKVVDFFNDVIESVRTYLGDSQGNSISRELKQNLDEYVKIRDKWMAALEKSAGVSEKSGSGSNNYNNGASDVRHSFVVDKGIFTDEYLEKNMHEVVKMPSVASITGYEFQEKDMDKLKLDIVESYKSIDYKAYNPVTGDVEIGNNFVKDTFAHKGINRLKIASCTVVPSVIENGKVVDYVENYKGKGYDRVTIAAPIKVTEGESKGDYNAVVIVNVSSQKNKAYLHGVWFANKKEVPASYGTRNLDIIAVTPGRSEISYLRSIFEKLLDVKQEVDSVSEADGNGMSYSLVTDDTTLNKLNSEKTVKVYRAMQVIDGKLYPPMAASVGKKLVDPIQLGKWEQADEHPELIKVEKNAKGEEVYKFVLDKGGKDATGKEATKVAAAYNPYIHTSRSILNDQFKSAWIRPNLVTVEVEVPVSELTSGYKAQYAKDAVGEVEWKSGSVSTQLAKVGKTRRVILSRYDRPVRILSTEEVASKIADLIGDSGISIPENVVTPVVREALEKKGITITGPEKGVNKTEQIAEAVESGLSVDNNIRYSITTDSNGKQLTEGQKKYFKDSNVVDENGNLMVMYHGTEEAGFTTFNPDYGKSSKAIFFSSSNDVAKTYSGTRDMYSPKSFKTAEELTDYIHSYMRGDEEYTVEKRGKEYVLLDDGEFADSFKNIDDVFNGFLEYSGFGGSSANYAVYLNVKNPYVVDANSENWDTLPELDGNTTTNGYADYARSHGYDGVIFRNISDSGLYASTQEKWGTSDVVAVFDPNQIKSVNNENPSVDDDIRYSLQNDGAEAVTKELAPEELYPERRFSLKMNDTIMNGALKANTSSKGATYGHADEAVLKKTTDLSKKVADRLEGLKMFLPADNPGQVLKANGSYGRSAENSLICPRSLVSAYFMDIVSEKLGKPLSINEQIVASQVLANITGMQKECTYCYVKNDRAKYREFFNEYYDSYFDTVAKVQKNREGYAESVRMGKENNPLYDEFLKGRTATDNMWNRYTHFVNASLTGELNLTLRDLATASTRFEAKKNKKLAWLVKDAENYCRSSAWPTSTTRKAKVDGSWKQVDYVSYNGSILKMKPELINALNNDFGLRLYSYSDYMPHNILENIQMITDASVRGLKVLAYTKDTGFAKVFAPTGAGINISVFGEMKNGQMIADEMMGANWEDTKALRKKYKNVGAVFVATNDDAVEWALKQDWIDVVIPFHTVRTGTEFANYYGYSNYKAEQEDKKLSTWNKNNLKSIPPTVHANDKATYLQALKDNNLSPRFSKWIDNPNYMKLVNETRMAYTDMQPVQANFNEADVMKEVDRIEREGVYGLPQGLRDREVADDLIEEYAERAVSEIGGTQYSLNVDDYHNEGTSAYNEAKAEQDKSALRRMLDIEESNNDYVSAAYSELQMANRAVSELLSNSHFMPAKKSIEYRAKKLIEQTGSARSVDDTVQKLSTLYEYIRNSDYVDGDMVSTVTTDIAEWLMSEEKPVYDENAVKNYNGFKSIIKGRKFRLGDIDWPGFDSSRARHFFGTLSVSRTKGTYIDEVWSELCDEAKQYNVILDESIANPVDMVNEIMDKLEENKPQPIRDERSEAEWKRDVYITGQSIFEEYFRTKFRYDQDSTEKLLKMYRTNINEYVNRKTESLKKQYQNRYIRFRENDNNRAARNSIIKNAKSLANTLAAPTNSKHIPEAFRVPIANFLSYIDFASENFYLNGNVSKRTADWLKMQNIVQNVIASNGSTFTDVDGKEYYMSIDPDLADKMETLTSTLEKEVRIDDLSRKELFALRDTLVSIKKCIENTNTMIGDRQKRKVSEFGEGTISELGNFKQKKEYANVLGVMDKLLTNEMLDATTRFHTFGKYAEDMLKEMREGFNKKVQLVKDASEYVKKLKDDLGVTDKEIRSWEKTEITYNGNSYRVDYIMSLYELMKRAQARDHILIGGITPAEYRKGIKKIKSGNIKLTADDVAAITGNLTQKQKDFADGISRYFLRAAEWGNRASMEAYGYRKFTDPNYFPIKTNANYRDSNTKDIMGDGTQAIRNLGMTKAVTPHANNPIMIESIMDVFTNHIEQMSSYAGFLIPLDDMQKWYNYRTVDERTGRNLYEKTVKTEIDRVYGKDANRYVTKFLKDINGTSQSERYFMKDLVSAFKGSAVGANLSVAIQQPTAYVRALAVMKPDYLIKGMNATKKVDYDIIKKYSSIAQWKDWGFFDTNVGQSMKSILTGSDRVIDDIREKQMWLAGKGDEITWGALWRASEYKVKSERPNLEVGTDEFYKAVAKVFDNVIDRTQVVDSVFHRSDVMRSKNDLTQMATSFMSEPTKSYNMVYRAIYDASRATKKEKPEAFKNITRTLIAFFLSAASAAAAKSVITAMRKSTDDKDKEFLDRWNEAFSGEFVENIMPWNFIPYVKDIASLFSGYSVDRTDMAAFKDWYYTFNRWKKYFSGESEYTLTNNLLYTTKAISDTTGVALYGLQRDLNAVIDTALEAFGLDKAAYLKYRVTGKRIEKGKSSYLGLAQQAYLKGNTALGDQIVNDMRDAGVLSDKDEEKALLGKMWTDNGWEYKEFNNLYEELSAEKKENKQEGVVEYIKSYDAPEEKKRIMWEIAGYADSTYDKNFGIEEQETTVKNTKQKETASNNTKRKETTSNNTKPKEEPAAKKTLEEEIKSKDIEKYYSYVVDSKDYTSKEKVEWLLSDDDKTSSAKYIAWKAVNGSDWDYIKHRADLEKFSGDDKQEKVVRYIKNQTNDAEKRKALWKMAGYKESTYYKHFDQ